MGAAPAAFGAIEFQEEYAKQIKAAETVSPLTGDLFGDSVSLYTGALEFSATDVSLPGNNALPVAFGRRFAIESRGEGALRFLLADWDIDIPHISTVVVQGQGWTVDLGANGVSQMRCAGPQDPGQVAPPAYPGNTSVPWLAKEFWAPPSLYIPGRGSQPILYTEGSLPQPPATKPYRWYTKDNTVFGCGPIVSGGQGDGFSAQTTDGLRYTFNHMVTLPYAGLIHKTGTIASRVVAREEVRLYPTSVTDRFGNSVTYTWNGAQLQSISGSDGRLLTFTYNGAGKIATVSDQSRTWTYSYLNGQLSTVTLPDSSQWQFTLASVLNGNIWPDTLPPISMSGPLCNKVTDFADGQVNLRTATITHPSGATGTFVLDARRHGRSYVDNLCEPVDPKQKGGSDYDYNLVPISFDTLSLTSKTISGAGIPTPYTWTYAYPHPVAGVFPGSTASMCVSSPCPTTKEVVVNEPDGNVTVHTFGIRYGVNEGQLLGTTIKNAANAIVRTQTFGYANAGGPDHPFPARMGILPFGSRADPFSAEQLHPQNQRTTTQDGATFSWTATRFDAFARPIREARMGPSLTEPRVDQTTYYDSTDEWVLGQVQSVHHVFSDNATRIKLAKTYSTTKAQVLSESSWGKLQKSYTYNADGTLATVTDEAGAAHAVALGDYHRGIPRLVTYPGGATESAVVNNLGQLESVTDEQGYMTTYEYWPTGKLKKVTPAIGDAVPWSPIYYQTDFVTGNEYGLVGPHWRRTVTTGNRNTITYYDVLMRPVLTREWDASSPSVARHRVTRFDPDNQPVFASIPLASLPLNTNPQDPNYQQPDYRFADQGTDTTYDAIGRPLSISADSELGPLLTSYTYPTTGFQRTITNPRGYSATTTFMAWDEPTYDYPLYTTAEDGVTTSIVRNVWGLTTRIVRGGTYGGAPMSVSRRYVYDDHMRLCKTIEPEGGGVIVDYDLAGNIAWTAPTLAATNFVQCERNTATAGEKSTRIYDARNRPLGVIHPTGTHSVNQTYYPDGALASVGSGGASWQYEYNRRRLLTKETLTVDNKAFTFDWTYDAQGSVASLTYPDGTYVDYAPDAFGRTTKVGAYASGVQYHLNDAIRQFTYANGAVHTLTQHPGRLLPKLSADTRSGTLLVSREYGYDANGNVDAIVDAAENIESKALTYDKFDRLTGASATGLWGAATFAYDPADNLRQMAILGNVYNYTIDATTNRVASFNNNGASTKTIGYDARGNVTTKGSQTFTFDKANRLLSATGVPGQVGSESYAYDGHGRRVSIQKSGQSGKRYTVYSQGGQLLHELDAQGRRTNYAYLSGTLLARVEDGAPTVPLTLSIDPRDWTSGNFKAEWNNVLTTGTYRLSVRRDSELPDIYTVLPPAISKTINNPDGGTYQIELSACPAPPAACSTASVSNYGVTPKQVAVYVPTSIQTGPYAVSWSESVGAGAYRVEESSNGGATYSVVSASTTQRSVTRPGNVNATYLYRVTALNSWGDRGGAVSDPVTVQIDPCTNVTSLATPVMDPITLDSPSGYQVKWSQPPCATAYTLEESTDNGTTWSAAPGYVSPLIPAVFQNRANGTYTYRVKASRPGTAPVPVSAWSNTRSVTIAVSTAPAIPGGVLVSAAGVSAAQHITVYGNHHQANLTWDAVSGAKTYEVTRTTSHISQDCDYLNGVEIVSGFSGNPPPAYLSGLPVPRVCQGTMYSPAEYSFTVRACNEVHVCSLESNLVSVTVEAQRPSSTTMEALDALTYATYYHTDALGSPVAESNASGTVTKRMRYEPYGRPLGEFDDRPGFTGHVADTLTELSYMQQRYYDPVLGRFLSIDPLPVGLRNGENFNRYAYAQNSPYRYFDPDGRCTGSHITNKDGTCVSSGEYTTKPDTLGRGFSAADVKTVGTPPADRPGMSKEVANTLATDMNRVKDILSKEGNAELDSIIAGVTLVADLDDWAKKYVPSDPLHRAFAKAEYQLTKITINARRYLTEKTMFFRVKNLIHEVRHLMGANSVLPGSNDWGTSEKETDAVRYAKRIVDKYWSDYVR